MESLAICYFMRDIYVSKEMNVLPFIELSIFHTQNPFFVHFGQYCRHSVGTEFSLAYRLSLSSSFSASLY